MDKYTIYCTKEQTKKALELGAKIEIQEYYPLGEIEPDWFHDEDKCYHIPTAEQMIGWLEDKSLQVTIHFRGNSWYYNIMSNYKVLSIGKDVSSRKEAVLAAIDATLDYLNDNSLIK